MPPAFSLQSVLDVRHSRVEALEIELGKLIQLQVNAQNLLNDFLHMLTELMDRLTAAQSGEVDLFAASVLRSNILTVNKQREIVEKELALLEVEIARKRAELITARQEEETLHILNRKRIEAYNAELNRIDAALQDDIYIAQSFRQRFQDTIQ